MRKYWIIDALAALQAIVFIAYCYIKYTNFNETFDFAVFSEATYLISHGVLLPYNPVQGIPYMANHSELLAWLIAALRVAIPSSFLLLILQCVATVVAMDICGRICWDTIGDRDLPHYAIVCLRVATLILIFANPWYSFTIARDFHLESFAAAFALLATHQIMQRRPRPAFLFAVGVLLCGNVEAVYVAAIGLWCILSRRALRFGALLIAVGTAWLIVTYAFGGGRGSDLGAYYGSALGLSGQKVTAITLLAALAQHPFLILATLWQHREALYANFAPAGGIGALTVWLFSVPLAVILENGLAAGQDWLNISFQNVAAFPFITIGTIWFLAGAARRIPRVAPLVATLAMVLAANTIAWAEAWLPVLSGQGPVSQPAAQELRRILPSIPSNDEVVASQGVLGRFADRRFCYSIEFGDPASNGVIPFHTDRVDFIITPWDGVSITSAAWDEYVLGRLATLPNTKLVSYNDNVYHFVLSRTSNQHALVLDRNPVSVPAWATQHQVGSFSPVGNPALWDFTVSGSQGGYAVAGARWKLPPGSYVASVTGQWNTPLVVEVWNAEAGLIVSETFGPGTRADVPFEHNDWYRPAASTFGDRGWFSRPAPGDLSDNDVEVRLVYYGVGKMRFRTISVTPLQAADSGSPARRSTRA